MNLKNHTTPRFWPLTGDRGEEPAYAHSSTYKFNLKDIPFTTRRMCNYLVGILISVTCNVHYSPGEAAEPEFLDASDIARALFESAEVQQTMFGTPVSPNHYLGRFFGLFEFIANGMQPATCGNVPVGDYTTPRTQTWNYFIPLSALLGMKGHHTAQPVVCYDRAQLILRTAASGAVSGLTVDTSADNVIKVSAIINPEPELRLGPGTSFMRYTQVASASGTIINVDSLGNSTTLEGAEPGAGIAWLAVMGNYLRHYGGAFNHAGYIEYLQATFRDIQMQRNLDPFFADWMNACGCTNFQYIDDDVSTVHLAGGGQSVGYLFAQGVRHGAKTLSDLAEFLPIITPRPFMEYSKVQVVQGTQAIAMKHTSGGFSGEHVFCALQAHSWTPAKQEEVLRKLIDSGVAMQVWGTNDLVPKVKVTNKQPAGSINPAKTRFFATTWEPKTVTPTPPTT